MIFHDITARKRAEHGAARLNETLEQRVEDAVAEREAAPRSCTRRRSWRRWAS